jgi:hypothetical protein
MEWPDQVRVIYNCKKILTQRTPFDRLRAGKAGRTSRVFQQTAVCSAEACADGERVTEKVLL